MRILSVGLGMEDPSVVIMSHYLKVNHGELEDLKFPVYDVIDLVAIVQESS